MIPGTVDRATGNVPLRLSGGYLVHFEGREDDGRVRARLAAGSAGRSAPSMTSKICTTTSTPRFRRSGNGSLEPW